MQIVECPRDAMQGWPRFISTATKIEYINLLLKAGFDTIDFGSFVSPKAIPQMRDTPEVVRGLELDHTSTKLLAIVANLRGAREAISFPEIFYLGYPLSISETFQIRNTGKTIAESFEVVEAIQKACIHSGKRLVVYLSMAFGNPYNEPYKVDHVTKFLRLLQDLKIDIISLADTIGTSTPVQIKDLYECTASAFPQMEIGLHLHAKPGETKEKIRAACEVGCVRIDGALRGYGGCPMADDELAGNIPTEEIIDFLQSMPSGSNIHKQHLRRAISFTSQVFT